ncbi:MAG TPA: hypothetical protein VFA64_09750, partial [Hyphomicrobiaceae bacterium]|nr:hypothetical protein [Hyphomicrobiaceae bacterium]
MAGFAQLPDMPQLVGQPTGLRGTLIGEPPFFGGLRALLLRRRLRALLLRVGLPGQQRFGFGTLPLGLGDEAARLLGELRLLVGRPHFLGLAARPRQHVGLVGLTPLG